MKNLHNDKKKPMDLRRSIHVFSVALLLATATSLNAQSYFNPLLIDELGVSHSRDAALAGANTSDYSTAMNTFSNPANQAGFTGLKLSGAFAAITSNENRSFPAIDQFGDVVTNNIYVVSKGMQNAFSFGASYGLERLTISLASTPFLTPAFTFKEELRGSLYSPNINRDPLIGYHHMNQSGIIQATGASLGTAFGSWSVGLGMRMLHGVGLENEYGISVLDSTDVSPLAAGESMLETESWDLDNAPVLLNFGLIKDFGLHWRVSASYQTGYSIESTRRSALPFYSNTLSLPFVAWNSDSVKSTIDIPAKLEVGLRMKPANSLPTSVFVSVSYQDWSQYEVTYADTGLNAAFPFENALQEAFKVSGGIEHWVNENVPFRAGFTWAESPIDRDLARSIISGGSGWKSGPLQFDVAVQLSSVGYRYFDIFIPVDMSPNAYENVQESRTNYTISVSYSL